VRKRFNLEDRPISRVRLHHMDESNQAMTISNLVKDRDGEGADEPRIPAFELMLDLIDHHFGTPFVSIDIIWVREDHVQCAGS
jgi:hypothetical protein